jgi:hypothetical protein
VRGATLHAAPVSAGFSEFRAACVRDLNATWFSATLTFSTDTVRAHNRIAAKVLREMPAISHVLWLDDDNWAELQTPEGVFAGMNTWVVREMIDTGEDLIGAPYTNKAQPVRWVHTPLPGESPDARGVLRVQSVGFGFTITSRRCLELSGDLARRYTDWPSPHKVPNIFEGAYARLAPGNDPEEEGYLSEDLAFCHRWRARGGHVCLYTRAGIIGHAGGYVWSARDIPGGVV